MIWVSNFNRHGAVVQTFQLDMRIKIYEIISVVVNLTNEMIPHYWKFLFKDQENGS